MNPTPAQRRLIQRVVNVFETGRPDGNYAAVTLLFDGPQGIRQVTYGRSQTTEYGNLKDLLAAYVQAGGTYSAALAPYLPKIGAQPLDADAVFLQLLKDAGKKDPTMKIVQDKFFDVHYFDPAVRWATEKGFQQALSLLVIYDSFIHSGTVRKDLRDRFPEAVPAKGGNEKRWIAQYVDTRHHWLANHPRKILQKTVYRTVCFQQQIDAANWDLSKVPLVANGISVN